MNDYKDNILLSLPSTPTKIKVTEINIKEGIYNDARSCPIALALKRYVKGDVLVTSAYIMFYSKKFSRKNIDMALGKNRIAAYETPEEVSTWIKTYEKKGRVKPFNFIFPLPTVQLKKTKKTNDE